MKKTILIFLTFVITPLHSIAATQDLGTYGKTYPIKEEDAMVEMKRAAASIDWEKFYDKKKTAEKIKNFRPKGMEYLPRAEKDSKRHIDITYTWNGPDIVDDKGTVIYPSGYSFNPFNFLDFPGKIVVIDGDDPEQVDWLKKSGYLKNSSVTLLLSGGSYYDLGKELGRPLFYAFPEVAAKLGLKAVPSVVEQDGILMQVTEIEIKKKRK
ncbi:MAG: hypothetical protein OEY64_12065 [Nitrospinota bacterium]|nr:hypothetical protein [Nitrospinota bacterium]